MFYEQYVKIWQDATAQLLLTLIAIFICTFILLSFDLFTSLIVTGVIAIIIIDMVGIMYLWDIELNAISLVNLVIVSIIFYHNSSFLSKSSQWSGQISTCTCAKYYDTQWSLRRCVHVTFAKLYFRHSVTTLSIIVSLKGCYRTLGYFEKRASSKDLGNK